MSAIDIYYKNQALARGIDTKEKAAAFSADQDRVYDALILPHLPVDKSVRIYEAACGPGLVLSWLGRKGYTQASGTDFCESYIEIAKASGLQADLKDSLLDMRSQPEGSIDVVFAIDFIEHLPKDIFIEFMYDVRRVLRPCGLLIMRAPNADSPLLGRNLFNDITHYWAYTSVSFRAISQIVGYSSISFIDEARAPMPARWFWLQPFSWLAQKFLRAMWALATRERINYLASSFFVIVRR